jgi:ribosomal protein S18 acetylase RimI-like enzyme
MAETEWQIRLVGPEDSPAVLAAEVFDGPALPDSVQRFLGQTDRPDPRNILLVAESGGRIVGFVSGLVMDHPDKPSILFIAELGVEEDTQRKGIGTALLRSVREEGRNRGCRLSWVATEGDNPAACALYRAAGGKETRDIVMFEWFEDDPG